MSLKQQDLIRVRALLDKSAWLLIALGAVVLGVSDWRMLLTLLSWAAFGAVLGGLTIILSKITFPTIRLSDWLERAAKGDMAAALIAAALILFVGLLFNGFVHWAAR